MLMFNFMMQREVAENLVFKRFWLEPVVKYELQIALLLLGDHTPSQTDLYQTPWCLLVPEHGNIEETFFHFCESQTKEKIPFSLLS